MYGGVEAFILNYVNHLPENKYTVELIIMNRTPQYLGEKLKREVKIHYVPERIKNPLGYNCRVNEIVKKGNYDILWCNFCTLSDILPAISTTKQKRTPILTESTCVCSIEQSWTNPNYFLPIHRQPKYPRSGRFESRLYN